MNEPTTLRRAERQRIQLQADILEAAFLEACYFGYYAKNHGIAYW